MIEFEKTGAAVYSNYSVKRLFWRKLLKLGGHSWSWMNAINA